MSFGGAAVRRLQLELKGMMKNPIPGLTIRDPDHDPGFANANSKIIWNIDIVGAEDTLYAGEEMHLCLKFCGNYPFDAPEVTFVQPNIPVHPHIYSNGHICLSILGSGWSPALSVNSICLSILSMLSSCKKKEPPANNASYVMTHKNVSPKDVQWVYHDDKV